MHERVLEDIKAIVYRDAYPDEESPNARQQTNISRCHLLIQEIESLIARNNRINKMIVIAYELGSREHFQIDHNKCAIAEREVLELLASQNCIDKEFTVVYSSKPKSEIKGAIA